MTKRSKTPSYVIELEARVTSADLHRIEKKQEISRCIYNACLGHLEKAWRGLQADPVRKSCLTELRRLNAIAKPSKEDKGRRIRVQQRLNKIAVQYGFTEFCLHEFAAEQKRHFHNAVGINEVQKIATRAWLAMQKVIRGEAKRVHYVRRGEAVTVENKTNTTGLRVNGQTFIWGKNVSAKLKVERGDKYAEDTFTDTTKFCRVITKTIRGKERVFVQLVKKGTPPTKGNEKSNAEGTVTFDLGPSAIAMYSPTSHEAEIIPLAADIGLETIEAEITSLQKRISRSLRLNNPHALDENGSFIKGIRLEKSNRCLKLLGRVADLRRQLAAKRKASHEALANRVLEHGDDVRTEDHGVIGWGRKAKKTRIRRKDGKICSKRRFGRSLQNRAPSMFRSIVGRKLEGKGRKLVMVPTAKVKASQYDPFTDTYTKHDLSVRWFMINGSIVQRDLFSAFLLSHTVGPNFDKVDREACKADWHHFLNAQATALKNAGIAVPAQI